MLPGEAYRRLVNTIYERDGWRCLKCRLRHALTPHHVIPRSQGGDDAADNLATLCVSCHDGMNGGGWREFVPRFQAYLKTCHGADQDK